MNVSCMLIIYECIPPVGENVISMWLMQFLGYSTIFCTHTHIYLSIYIYVFIVEKSEDIKTQKEENPKRP